MNETIPRCVMCKAASAVWAVWFAHRHTGCGHTGCKGERDPVCDICLQYTLHLLEILTVSQN